MSKYFKYRKNKQTPSHVIHNHIQSQAVDEHDMAEFWKDVAIAVASSSNAIDKGSMATWADRAVSEFQSRVLKGEL